RCSARRDRGRKPNSLCEPPTTIFRPPSRLCASTGCRCASRPERSSRADVEAHAAYVQAQEISNGLEALSELLEEPIAREALDLGKNAETAASYDILRRL